MVHCIPFLQYSIHRSFLYIFEYIFEASFWLGRSFLDGRFVFVNSSLASYGQLLEITGTGKQLKQQIERVRDNVAAGLRRDNHHLPSSHLPCLLLPSSLAILTQLSHPLLSLNGTHLPHHHCWRGNPLLLRQSLRLSTGRCRCSSGLLQASRGSSEPCSASDCRKKKRNKCKIINKEG